MSDFDLPERPRATFKTYSHLLGQRRLPTEYEVLTSRLLYYVGRGFEVDVPLSGWYQRCQQGSPLRLSDWERFADPRETTYARYTRLQRDREVFVDGLLHYIDDTDYDRGLPSRWVDVLFAMLPPLRYPLHGLQMIAAYVGQMAPGGRVVVCALMQAADEVRRIQRIAYRLAQLRRAHPDHAGIGEESRAAWQADPRWQPLREVIERLLITYDWGEALIGLNLCVKPVIDAFVLQALPTQGRAQGDPLLGEIFFSLDEDARWQRAWTAALLGLLLAESADNRAAVQRWVDRWLPPALRAAAALLPLLPGDGPAVLEVVARAQSGHLHALGLAAPPGEEVRP